MRVVCPACKATYEVPAAIVQARRTVRCTACSSRFAAGEPPAETPPAPTPAPAAVPAPPADMADIRAGETGRLPTSAEPPAHAARARPAMVLAAWAFSLVLLAAGAGAALAWRQPIMRAWPPSTRAYAALGYLR